MPSIWIKGARALRLLIAALFAAYNLIPLYGAWAWQWDAFQILILYWSETVILVGWTLLRLRFVPPNLLGTVTVNGKVVPASYTSLIGLMALTAAGQRLDAANGQQQQRKPRARGDVERVQEIAEPMQPAEPVAGKNHAQEQQMRGAEHARTIRCLSTRSRAAWALRVPAPPRRPRARATRSAALSARSSGRSSSCRSPSSAAPGWRARSARSPRSRS